MGDNVCKSTIPIVAKKQMKRGPPKADPNHRPQRQAAMPRPLTRPPPLRDQTVGASTIDDEDVTNERPFYLQRQRFQGFRDMSQLPTRGSLSHLSIEDRILLKKRLLQHRLQEMIQRLERQQPEKVQGPLADKIRYLKELATRP
eukprot:TRINITY_DN4665_c0_g1_i1.p1 TRINITY_DN4665_c0_g1~~TRINITY_DN4665_c0_g1_i1.p1  ORF type:complete len:144 (+),score=29.09 TRINITY_DN4665_c0_g1_i1:408-839(+)